MERFEVGGWGGSESHVRRHRLAVELGEPRGVGRLGSPDRYESSVDVVGPSPAGSYDSGESGLSPSSAPLEPPPFASCTCLSSALSTWETCWFTIGWRTRCPMDATGPRMWTS